MIVVQLCGGLGNQMFQYAAGRSLADFHNVKLKLDAATWSNSSNHKPSQRTYSLGCFNINSQLISPVKLKMMKLSMRLGKIGNLRQLNFINYSMYNEPHLNYDKNFYGIPNRSYLVGYWQTEKYFKRIESMIRNDFEWRFVQTDPNKKISELISNSDSVSIHIRRGDYINDPQTSKSIGTCPLDYYYASIKEIEKRIENPIFFVFSDDINWVKKSLEIKHPVYYADFNNEDNSFEDLRLMSLCKHNIIANSSFSWWGAWLNKNTDKMIIAPQKWFKDSLLNTQSQDIIPAGWITM